MSSEEVKELVLSLPKAKGLTCNTYLYKGYWHIPSHLVGILNFHTYFKPLDSDILVVTPAKCGTTWLKSLVFTLIHRHVHPVNAPHDHPLTSHNPHDLIPFLEIIFYEKNQITISSPRLLSTHVGVQCLPSSVFDSNCKIVYLCRDPKDTFVSFWHFANKLRETKNEALSLEEAFDIFYKGTYGGGPYPDHVLGYWKESLQRPNTVMFLKYEDMKKDIFSCVRRLAEFLECPFSVEEEKEGVVDGIVGLCCFDNLSKLDVNKNGKQHHPKTVVENQLYFRRGEVGDWVNYLTPEMSERLDRIMKKTLHGSGLNF